MPGGRGKGRAAKEDLFVRARKKKKKKTKKKKIPGVRSTIDGSGNRAGIASPKWNASNKNRQADVWDGERERKHKPTFA